MTTDAEAPQITYWLLGAFWSDRDPADQTLRFIREGLWENGTELNESDNEKVKMMRPGDRVAIKAATTQKLGLPFDAGNRTVSTLHIKATGTITSNMNDGQRIAVEWDRPPAEPRRWYFYTYRPTIWRLKSNDEYAQRLIHFTFFGEDQDVDWFRERFLGTERHEESSLPASGPERSEAADDPSVPFAAVPYSLDDIIAEGAFVPRAELEMILDRWRSKKNLILQGSPGVGKTFLAHRLAYALMEERSASRVSMVQFHQSYSYDDFVRGYRPASEGGFQLQDGIFYDFCTKAAADIGSSRPWVFIVDEINRGNLAQIFGELLMLIEDDKRSESYAVPLVYRRDSQERFHIPPNVYFIGLMNIADRSLALVDYALRRRFAFLTLRPQYNSKVFRDWLIARNMSSTLVHLVVERMTALNDRIASDKLLGDSFQIGHSFFCPKGDDFTDLARSWYDSVVETEVVPLLQEYWFDDRGKVTEARDALLAP